MTRYLSEAFIDLHLLNTLLQVGDESFLRQAGHLVLELDQRDPAFGIGFAGFDGDNSSAEQIVVDQMRRGQSQPHTKSDTGD